METIFALSSGSPPAAIAVVRVSGPLASEVLQKLGGSLPQARQASARPLHDGNGDVLDFALVLWLPGPATVTGEDMAEFHLHGGRAVVSAVEAELAWIEGVRRAEPGEFTRRAFANGRIDLAESEGLADLLEAETELQRRAAMAMAGGALSRVVEGWREKLLILSAQVEAALDFSDEEDAAGLPHSFSSELAVLEGELQEWVLRPRARVLKEGFRVVLAGPPNAGKSTLFNALVEDEAAITAPTAGTTRDVIQRSVALGGIAFTFVDTAGLHDNSRDEIERIGITRARDALELADVILWLGPEGEGPAGSWEITAKIDIGNDWAKAAPRVALSATTGEGLEELRRQLMDTARVALPGTGQAALSERQHQLLSASLDALTLIDPSGDLLLIGEALRLARTQFDRLVGRSTTEDMLDTLFGRFCIGK